MLEVIQTSFKSSPVCEEHTNLYCYQSFVMLLKSRKKSIMTPAMYTCRSPKIGGGVCTMTLKLTYEVCMQNLKSATR